MAKPEKSKKASSSPKTIDAGTGEVLASQTSPEQAQELERCEVIIKKGLATFLEVGKALAEIRDKGLYKGKYDSFDLYWRKELGISRTYAYNLIGSAEVNQQLSSIENLAVKPLTESQLRELIPVPEANRVDAWKRAVELAGEKPVTAKIVRKAAVKFRIARKGKTKPKKATKPSLDLEPALKLLAKVEKAADQSKNEVFFKDLQELRELLEGLGKA